MVITIEKIRYLSGFFNSSFYVLTNLFCGWGKLQSIRYTIPVILGHNILDTLLGQYWKTDKWMLLHHLISVLLTLYVLSIKSFTNDQYNFAYWISFAEVSSIFNCLRWFFKDTKYQGPLDLTFGISFLTIRPLTVIKTFDSCCNISKYLLIFWGLYTGLNIYWCYCMLVYSKRIKNAICEKIK